MALCFIEEYLTSQAKLSGQVAQEPSNTSQTPLVIAASSSQSAPFGANTYMIRVHVDAIASVAIGPNPTAVITNKRFAKDQTEYFGVLPGHSLAVIANV